MKKKDGIKIMVLLGILVLSGLSYYAVHASYSAGKVAGCQIAFRDLYAGLGITNIDEGSLLNFCKEATK